MHPMSRRTRRTRAMNGQNGMVTVSFSRGVWGERLTYTSRGPPVVGMSSASSATSVSALRRSLCWAARWCLALGT
jgi:hypothetical protein